MWGDSINLSGARALLDTFFVTSSFLKLEGGFFHGFWNLGTLVRNEVAIRYQPYKL